MSAERILIVEDDLAVQKMYRRFFELEKYQVETADDGLSGLELARRIKPDLIALDIMVPGMDGIKVLTELKGDPATRHIPVVMLTNLGDDSMVEKCLKIGAAAYMVKINFTPSEVVSKIRYYLANPSARSQDDLA